MNWIDLVSADQIETIKKESYDSPVLIFKHSTTCSISAMAFHRLQRNAFDAKFYYLDLKANREISNLVASAFDVIHESPQVLIIDKGVAVYHWSHSDINASEIREALIAN